MRSVFSEELALRCLAAVIALAMVLLMGGLLMRAPTAADPGNEPRMRVRYLSLVAMPRSSPVTATSTPRTATRQPASTSTLTPLVHEPLRRDPAASTAPLLPGRLYTPTGQARLPANVQVEPMPSTAAASPPGLPNERELEAARKRLYPPNPVQVAPNRFAKDWTSDGTLGDVAAQKLGRASLAITKKIFGEDPQSVRARPPPELRFNPVLYEQASDLGSEATGDAYRAAPIAFEKAPGLEGEASRRIRARRDELRLRYSTCKRALWQRLMMPVELHLKDLQQAEHAMQAGTDPVMAEHMLPRRADNAYDQARRALWYANQQLARCQG